MPDNRLQRWYETFDEAYPYIIRDVRANGHKASPRGQEIREMCGYSFGLYTTQDSLPLHQSRKLNVKFGIIEGLCNVYGDYPMDVVSHFNKKILDFPTPPYAPRLNAPLDAVIKLLKEDPNSRQAFLPIFCEDDIVNPKKGETPPCTMGLQLLVRDSKVNMIATMRSNDVLWGLTYDVNQFMMVQRAVASALGIPTGWYLHQAGSMHEYVEREALLDGVLLENEKKIHIDLPHQWPTMEFKEMKEQLAMLFFMLNSFIVTGEEDVHLVPMLKYPFSLYYEYLAGRRTAKKDGEGSAQQSEGISQLKG